LSAAASEAVQTRTAPSQLIAPAVGGGDDAADDESEDEEVSAWADETDPRYHRGNGSVLYAASDGRLSTVMESDDEDEAEERARVLAEIDADEAAGRLTSAAASKARRRMTATPKRRRGGSIGTALRTPLDSVQGASSLLPVSSSAGTAAAAAATSAAAATAAAAPAKRAAPEKAAAEKAVAKKDKAAPAAVVATAPALAGADVTKGKGGVQKAAQEPAAKRRRATAAPEQTSAADVGEAAEDGAEDVCGTCGHEMLGRSSTMIGCDGACARWYHPKCVGLARAPSGDGEWRCPSCVSGGGGGGSSGGGGAPKAPAAPDFAAMRVAELRAACADRGLDSAGTKAVLVARLFAAVGSP